VDVAKRFDSVKIHGQWKHLKACGLKWSKSAQKWAGQTHFQPTKAKKWVGHGLDGKNGVLLMGCG